MPDSHRSGAHQSRIEHQREEMDAVEAALDWAQPGDLVILLIHEDLDAVLDYLSQRVAATEQR